KKLLADMPDDRPVAFRRHSCFWPLYKQDPTVETVVRQSNGDFEQFYPEQWKEAPEILRILVFPGN
ncbi:hypothetical protein LCGC14_2850060, partial [marine sediment metagenome]